MHTNAVMSAFDPKRTLADDLIRHKVNLIIGGGDAAIIAARAATATVPMVFVTGDDPVKLGYVVQLNSPLVRRNETDRIMGAASTTTGSIVTHEMTQDNSRWARNWRIVTNGKLATPAAIRHVNPA